MHHAVGMSVILSSLKMSRSTISSLNIAYEDMIRKKVPTGAISNGSDGSDDYRIIAERNSLDDSSANRIEGGNVTGECEDVSSGNVVNLVENVLQTHGSL